MKREFLPHLVVGLIAVAIVVAGLVYLQWGAHAELRGSIQKVRTLGFDEDPGSVAVVDFRFWNRSNVEFWVRDVEVQLDTKDGKTIEGRVVSEFDAKRLFEYYPTLGQKFNDTLQPKTKIAPGESLDRMLAVRFEAPEQIVRERKQLRILVEEIDGPVSEIRENAE